MPSEITSPAALRVALVPLDERPVNTRYPQMLGAIAGADVLLPPAEVLGKQKTPSDRDAVANWLAEAARTADAAIVSAEFLLYGNLINSRISQDSALDVLPRLKPVEAIGASGKPVYLFGLITRVSNADDCVEEPDYWATWGTRFYKFSALLHKQDAGELTDDETQSLQTLRDELPPDLVNDWLARRLRNHAVNLALLDLAARARVHFLLLTSDDTSPWGTPSREKAWLMSWAKILGPAVQNRVLLHPGADEVGSALLARFLCEARNVSPRIYPLYAVPGGKEITAPYEDRAVRLTVEGQIHACGATLAATPEDADIILGVTPPSPRRTEWRTDFAGMERADREGFYKNFLSELGKWQQNKPVAIGDVAYPNGADPLLMELLLAPDCPVQPGALAAFGAWNTAGNTLGVVVAQAVCSLFIGNDPTRQAAQNAFLTHRFLEDWGYQTLVRREARTANRAAFGTNDPNPQDDEQIAFTAQSIETGLQTILTRLQERGVGVGLSLKSGSVRLPWNRTFEADFDLEQTGE